MNTLRFCLCSNALAAMVFTCSASICVLLQQVSAETPPDGHCAGSRCAIVRIDHVTRLGSDGQLRYITAFGNAGTYILSCVGFLDCHDPIAGKEYEYSEQPVKEPGDIQYAYLTGPKVNHEQYDVDVILRGLPLSKVLSLTKQCQSSDQLADEADCGKWITRRLAIMQAACPDPRAASACHSFQELVRANDPSVMYDLAHRDHVYACFLPQKDELFEVTFSEPNMLGFQAPSAEEVKEGVPSGALTVLGMSEFSYYKNGVGDDNKSIQDLGNWIYFDLGNKADLQSMRKNATSKQAEFKSKNIDIEGDHWILTETYKNQADTQTRHIIKLQLATGRFEETFDLVETGKEVGESSGKCMIVPSNYF